MVFTFFPPLVGGVTRFSGQLFRIQVSCIGRLIIFSLLESWYVASKFVCALTLTLYKQRSRVLTSSLKLSVLCERLRIRLVISGLLTGNHGFRFR